MLRYSADNFSARHLASAMFVKPDPWKASLAGVQYFGSRSIEVLSLIISCSQHESSRLQRELGMLILDVRNISCMFMLLFEHLFPGIACSVIDGLKAGMLLSCRGKNILSSLKSTNFSAHHLNQPFLMHLRYQHFGKLGRFVLDRSSRSACRRLKRCHVENVKAGSARATEKTTRRPEESNVAKLAAISTGVHFSNQHVQVTDVGRPTQGGSQTWSSQSFKPTFTVPLSKIRNRGEQKERRHENTVHEKSFCQRDRKMPRLSTSLNHGSDGLSHCKSYETEPECSSAIMKSYHQGELELRSKPHCSFVVGERQ